MFRKNFRDKQLDDVGQRVVRGSVLSDDEVEKLALSPFLLTRVRARISDLGEIEESGIWSNFLVISRKAIPVMSLAAAFSLGLFLYTGNKSTNAAFSVDAYLGASESRIERLVFAERQPVTADEVLATIVTRDEREPVR